MLSCQASEDTEGKSRDEVDNKEQVQRSVE